jgi:DNA invertase Pin-like site-specific DNA recombinase
MDRPALQKLLIDVEARRIDVIVVYKVDRLTGRQAALDPTGSRNPGVLADGI